MPKESKTIQVYPDDEIINKEIKNYEAWGWELINNQRFQEFVRQDVDGTRHYETFNKLTFSRDKDAPWYKEIRSLESEYNCLHEPTKPVEPEKYEINKGSIFPAILMLLVFFPIGIYLLIRYFIDNKDLEQRRQAEERDYSKRVEEYKKQMLEYPSDYEEYVKRRDKILARRAKLLG